MKSQLKLLFFRIQLNKVIFIIHIKMITMIITITIFMIPIILILITELKKKTTFWDFNVPKLFLKEWSQKSSSSLHGQDWVKDKVLLFLYLDQFLVEFLVLSILLVRIYYISSYGSRPWIVSSLEWFQQQEFIQ